MMWSLSGEYYSSYDSSSLFFGDSEGIKRVLVISTEGKNFSRGLDYSVVMTQWDFYTIELAPSKSNVPILT
jgi:hypothetical protein